MLQSLSPVQSQDAHLVILEKRKFGFSTTATLNKRSRFSGAPGTAKVALSAEALDTIVSIDIHDRICRGKTFGLPYGSCRS
jgi:hypothetical protein